MIKKPRNISLIVLVLLLFVPGGFIFPQNLEDSFIVLFLNGYGMCKDSDIFEEEDFITRSYLRKNGLDKETYPKTGYRNIAQYHFSSAKSRGEYTYVFDKYLRELGDFNTGTKLLSGVDPITELQYTQQCFLSLAKCEWVYRKSTIIFANYINPDGSFKTSVDKDNYSRDINNLLRFGPSFPDLLIAKDLIKTKLNNVPFIAPGPDTDDLAQELYDIATAQPLQPSGDPRPPVPNRFRFVCHSTGGMVLMKYLTEQAGSAFAFYNRFQDYNDAEYADDLARYPEKLGPLQAACNMYTKGGAPQDLHSILKMERENIVEQVVDVEAPIGGIPLVDLYNNLINDPLLGDKAANFLAAIDAAAAINAVMSVIMLAYVVPLLTIYCPPCAPVLAAFCINAICWDLGFMFVGVAVIGGTLGMTLASNAASYGEDGFMEMGANGPIVAMYKDSPPPEKVIGSGEYVQINTLSATGGSTVSGSWDLGGCFTSWGIVAEWALGVYQLKLSLGVAGAGAISIINLLSMIGENDMTLEQWVVPLVLALAGFTTTDGSVLIPKENTKGTSTVINLTENKSSSIKPIADNDNVNHFFFETDTGTYGSAKEIAGDDLPPKNWNPFWPSDTGSKEYIDMHGWAKQFVTTPVVYEGEKDNEKQDILFKGTPLLRKISSESSSGNDIALPVWSYIPSSTAGEDRTYFSFFMKNNQFNSSTVLVKSINPHISLDIKTIEGIPHEKGLTPAKLDFVDINQPNPSGLNVRKYSTVNYVIVNEYIKAFPLEIFENHASLKVDFSINGGGFVRALSFGNISGFASFDAYSDSMSQTEQLFPSLVIALDGKAILVSPHFKEGYNTVYFRFTDPYGFVTYKELSLMQVTVPPFIKPVAPLMNEYIGSSSFQGAVQALDISQGAIKPANWWNDPSTSFEVTIDGSTIPYLKRSDFTVTFNLSGLADGNHQIDFTAHAVGLTCAQSWRFWVDTHAPVVTFPQKMLFSNNDKQNTGGLSAYIKDTVPFTYASLVKDVDTVMLSNLKMTISDSGGYPLATYLDKSNISLGGHGGSWNGWVNDVKLAHGKYYLNVDATDRTGNTAHERGEVIIDNQGPFFNSIDINTSLVNCDTGLLELSYNVGMDEWEDSSKLEMLLDNTTINERFTLKTNCNKNEDGTYVLAYFASGLNVFKDGVYNLTVTPIDTLGNRGVRKIFSNIVVDRTRPNVKNAYVSPFFIESGATSISVFFTPDENDDAVQLRSGSLPFEIELLDSYGNEIAPLSNGSAVTGMEWKGNGLAIPASLHDGKYFMRMRVRDAHDNVQEEVVPFVKNAIGPEIISPLSNEIVDGVVTIKGNVVDPRFSNNLGFDRYEMYWKYFADGDDSRDFDVNDLGAWSNSALSVPEYQKNAGWPASWGRFTVEGGDVLGFLDTRNLNEGLVIVLVVAAEKPESAGGTGYRIGSWRTFRVLRGGASQYTVAVTVDPAFANGGSFDFGEGGVLSIPYTVDHAIDNPVTVDCFVREDVTGKIVRQGSFVNLHSNHIKGVPQIDTNDKGFFIYQKETDNKFYITLKNSGTASANFFCIISTKLPMTGFVDASGNPIVAPQTLIDDGKKLMLTKVLPQGESYTLGFSVAENDEINFTGLIDQAIPDEYLGGDKVLVKSGNIILYPGTGYPPFVWDGMDEFGRFVPNGSYTIGIEAFGALGGRDSKLLPFTIATPEFLRWSDADISNRTFYPGVPGLEYCGIKVHVNKPAVIGAYVRDTSTKNHVKTLEPDPIVMANIGYFTVKWYGDDDTGSIVTPGTYEFVVTATPSDGSAQAAAVIPDIRVNAYQPVDPSVKAEIAPFAEENPASFNDKELLHGDTKYQIKVKPQGSFLPDKSGTITVAAKSGTQVAEAYPDLNYMAALRTSYELWARAGLTVTVTVKVKLKRYISFPTMYEYVDEYYTFNFNAAIKDGLLLNWNFQENRLNRSSILFEGSANLGTSPSASGDFAGIEDVGVAYRITSVYGSDYIDPNFYQLELPSINIVHTVYCYCSGTCFYTSITCTIDHYKGEVRAKSDITGVYHSYATGFSILGPDVPSQGDDNLHTTPFVSRTSPLASYSFKANDPGSLQTALVWRQNPSYHFYYVGESYPVLPTDPQYQPRAYNPVNLKEGSLEGVGSFDLPVSFQSRTFANGSVNFMLTQTGTQYGVSVTTDAYDNILYPYPAINSIFNTRHKIPDAYNPDLPIPTLVINGGREMSPGGEIIPSFHVPFTDRNGVTNLYFDTDPKPEKVFPIVFTFDTAAKSYVDKDGAGIDLRELLSLEDPMLEKVSMLKWGVSAYDVLGLTFANLLGIERSRGEINGLNNLIRFPQDAQAVIDMNAAKWSLLDDSLIQQLFGSGTDTLAGLRTGLNTDDLHRQGKLDRIYVSSLYPSGNPAADDKNMFFVNSDLTDNPGIIIDKSIDGNYTIQINGLDNNPYNALLIDPLAIVYGGKGNKLSDSFEAGLTGHDPKRLVAIRGSADESYSLSYKDAKGNWIGIDISNPAAGILTYWDITGLNGLYTLRLISQRSQSINLALKEVYLGNKVVPSQDTTTLESSGGQAKIIFPPGSVTEEKIISIDAVTLDEVKDIAILPDIAPVGKVVKFGPPGTSFENLPEYLKPQVHFVYHKFELGTLNPFELAIWYLTDAGKLEALPTIKVVHVVDGNGNDSVVWRSDENTEAMFPSDYTYLDAFGSMPHFSYYLMLEGNRLESPVINEKDFATNKTTTSVTGTGALGMQLKIFVVGSPFFDPHAQALVMTGDALVGPDGKFYISNVPLPFEGYNFIYVGYDTASASEYSKLVVTRDTTPPLISISPYNQFISPNNDGRQDSIDLLVTSSETGHVTIQIMDTLSNSLVYEKDIACLLNIPVTFSIKGIDTEGFVIRDGNYSIKVKAFDSLDNCTVNDGNPLVIDTIAPHARIVSHGDIISPANKDGNFDILAIDLDLGENATVDAWIGNYSDTSQKKLLDNLPLDAGTITFLWDGKNDRGEYVRDGNYFLRVNAYDKSGNITDVSFPDQRTVVDNTPPQVALNVKDMQVFVVPAPLSFGFTVSEETTASVSILDNAGRVYFTNTGIYPRGNNSVVFNAGEEVPDGYYSLVMNASDDALNSASPVSKIMEFTHDRQPPDLTLPPDLVAEAIAIITPVDIGQAYASDQSPPITISNDSPGSFGLGTTTISWSASDRYGNKVTKMQSITVRDTTPPSITVPIDVTAEASGISTPVRIGIATATDIFQVTISNNAPEAFGIGTTFVTWTARDSNGNMSAKVQKVTIVDTTPPILNIPADVSVKTTTALTEVNIGTATATDIFPVTVTNDAPLFFPLGVTYVSWLATDANGNKTSAKQKIVVSTGTFTASGDSSITKQAPNKNEGASRTLSLDSSPESRVLIKFDLRNVRLEGLKKATIVLTIDPFECGWNRFENTGKAYKILSDWTEGNGAGESLHHDRHAGTGAGVTWNSPSDRDISNNKPDGNLVWDGGSFEKYGVEGNVSKLGVVHLAEWDVTKDVLEGATFGWLIKTDRKEWHSDLEFYSREGAVAIGKLAYAPQLILEYE